MAKESSNAFALNEMDLKELETLRNDVDKAISTLEQRRRQEALSALRNAAKEHGFNLEELLTDSPKGKTSGSRRKVPPKYVHPEDPSKTWSGRGRQPQWVKDHLDAGNDIKDLEI